MFWLGFIIGLTLMGLAWYTMEAIAAEDEADE